MNLTSPIDGGGLPPKKKFRSGGEEDSFRRRGSLEGDFRPGGYEGNE